MNPPFRATLLSVDSDLVAPLLHVAKGEEIYDDRREARADGWEQLLSYLIYCHKEHREENGGLTAVEECQ
jgi:hypothetical protein